MDRIAAVPGGPRRLLIVPLVAWALMVGMAPPAAAQGAAASADLCLLTVDEMSQVTGLPFATMAAGDANCAYASDPAADLFTIDLRVERPESPIVGETMEDGLFLVRFDYPDGQDVRVAGYPSWESDHGLWVDIGPDVFVVQPILFFSDEALPARSFMTQVAELALSRYTPPTPGPSDAPDSLGALFPESIGGTPVEVDLLTGAELFGLLDGTPAVPAHKVAAFREALTLLARTEDDVTSGFAEVRVQATGDQVGLAAIRIAGADASLALEPIGRLFAQGDPGPVQAFRAGGKDALLLGEAGMTDARTLYASDDVAWVIQANEPLLGEILEALP